MITEYVVPVIRTVCPKGMDENNCRLRKYLKNEQKIFDISQNESYLVPNTSDAQSLVWTFIRMRSICAQCKADNNQKMK